MSQDKLESQRNGTERAAILLLSLGEAEATEVMKHMGAKDVQRIGAAMTQLQNISRQEVQHVLADFTNKLEEQTALGIGVDDYLRKVLIGALGEDKAGGVIDRIAPGLRAHYQAKRTVMERALETHLQERVQWQSPRGGFFLWIQIPGADDRQLFDRAIKEKVSFVLGSAFFVDGGGHEFARLAFSGISHAQIEQGISRLAMAMNAPPE